MGSLLCFVLIQAEQYALYRKLSKAAKPSASSSKAGSNREEVAGTSQRRDAARAISPPPAPMGGDRKRAAPSTPQRTPKRTKAYTGAGFDPNPFSLTPKKQKTPVASSPFKSFAASAKALADDHTTSPFIVANSPRKMKDLVQANSLRARKERAEAEKNTPRSRARRRLAGEDVEDSPVKIRRRRGKPDPAPFGDAFKTMDVDEDEDDDEALGPTPVKPGVESFSLLASVEKPKPPKLGIAPKGRSDAAVDLFPLFKRVPVVESKSPAPPVVADGLPGPAESPAVNGNAPPPTEVEKDMTASTSTPRRTEREHILDLSDDEWDPEATPRKLRITGTKRRAVKVHPDVIASDDEDGVVEADVEDNEEEERDPSIPDTPGLLSLLSLRSPGHRRDDRVADLRVRALLDPNSAAAVALRAHERGQDVFTCGEGLDEEAEDDLLDARVTVEGDDDWESDPEGWKVETQEEIW